MNRCTMLALSGGALLGLAGFTQAETTEDLRSQIADLKGRLANVEAKQQTSWIDARRAEEIKALVQEVMADADTRASLLADGATAGHNGSNFFLASADGAFLLRVSGLVQIRHTYNFRDDPAAPVDKHVAGFEVRRAKVQFDGHVGSPRLSYAIRLAVDNGDDSVDADRVVIGYDISDTMSVYVGEDKAPFLREELTEAGNQLAVDRSLTNEIFTAGYIQGAWLTAKLGDSIKATLALTDGARSGEIDGDTKPFQADNSDFAITGRIDVRLAGDWAQAKDFSAWSGEQMAIFLGGAFHYEVSETGNVAPNDSFFAWTVDGSLETSGFNLYAAVVGAHTDPEVGDGNDFYGFLVQAGYMVIPDKLEPFVRYEYIDFDDTTGATFDDSVSILTFGANWYLKKQTAKLSMDVVWIFDALDPAVLAGHDSQGLGILANAADGDNQVVIRTQLTLTY